MNKFTSALLVTGLVAASLLTAVPASAHDDLAESNPAAGETIDELPDEFSITMSEDLPDLGDAGSGFGIQVQDSNGLYYGDGCVTVEGPTMSAAAVLGQPGEYTLVWQVVSSDGHPTSGEFTFIWAPKGKVAAAAGEAEPGDCNGQYVRDGVAATENDAAPSIALTVGVLAVIAVLLFFVLRRRK